MVADRNLLDLLEDLDERQADDRIRWIKSRCLQLLPQTFEVF